MIKHQYRFGCDKFIVTEIINLKVDKTSNIIHSNSY